MNVKYFFRFACGRWLGRGVDDGSTERLLVGQLVPRTVDSEELVEACRTPPRSVSPSVHRPEIRPSDIQHMLGDCVNAIVKWHYRPNRERDTSSLTNLLCGEDGLAKLLRGEYSSCAKCNANYSSLYSKAILQKNKLTKKTHFY